MNIIDVTLRDGGHAVQFNWPMQFAQDYYSLVSSLDQVRYVELGYWKQTTKSTNPFYNLNFDTICNVTQRQELNNVSIMIDYHYCSKVLEDYPTGNQSEIAMIRICSRKEDIDKALKFGAQLKSYTKLQVSLNIFNASNYTYEELDRISRQVEPYQFDYVYFADTHGSLNLTKDFDIFRDSLQRFKNSGKSIGFHLHDHSGLAVVNYNELIKNRLDSTDTSIRGMGKGSGNLKLEHVVNKDKLADVAEFIRKYESILTINPTPYELITSKYGITDNYAKKAKQLNLTINEFDKFCRSVKLFDRDSYNRDILNEYINNRN